MPNAELYKFSDFCSENKVRAETAEMSSQRIRNQRFLEFFFLLYYLCKYLCFNTISSSKIIKAQEQARALSYKCTYLLTFCFSLSAFLSLPFKHSSLRFILFHMKNCELKQII